MINFDFNIKGKFNFTLKKLISSIVKVVGGGIGVLAYQVLAHQ